MTEPMRGFCTTESTTGKLRLSCHCLLVIAVLISGCAERAAGGARSPASAVSPAAPGAGPVVGGAVSPPPASGATPVPAPIVRAPEIVLDPKAPVHPLPELKIENIGLHIGGGPNDSDTKAPFLRAVSARFPAFADCYRKNEDPAKGGRFGVDLHIARAGGHPRLEQPRTAMRGADFRACMLTAFESVEFEKPKLGPTTISYAVRFTLEER